MAAVMGGNDIEVPGGLAQLGEHLLCKQGVVGSIPSTSTIIIIVHHYLPHHTEDKTVKSKRESACT